MNLPEPFYETGEHLGIDLPGSRAAFTTRRGGLSAGPYASLNLGLLTDDEREAVERNRALLQAGLGVPFAFGRQVHGTMVATAGGPSQHGPALQAADGQATTTTRLGLMVLTADCLPIAVGAPGAVAMLHAGWRGLAGGIVEVGVRAIRDLGAGGSLVAAIGPGAGACCYEVGDEVHAAFTRHREGVRRGQNLDLKAIARSELERAGVDQIHDVELCTICSDPNLFYSHRRDQGITGRQAGVAWLS